MKQAGKFYGIGVGPGDPELMTLKAVRTIRDCDVIVLPVSNRELTEPLLLEQNEMENRAAGYLESCTAYQIAVQTVSELKEKQILFLPMPMIKDKEKLRKIHARGEQEEQIHILPGSYEEGEGLQLSGTKILMKTGKKMGQIKEFLQGSSQDICLVENCGMDDERIVRSVEEISEDAGYYSLLIVKDRKR